MRKFAMIVAVLLALGLVASCGAKKKVVTKWSATGPGGTSYLTFYNDGTAEMTSSSNDEVNVATYTGDTRKDGTITVNDGYGTTAEIRGDTFVLGGFLTYTKVKE